MKVCVIGTRGFPCIEGGVEKHCEFLYSSIATDMEIIVLRRKPYVTKNLTCQNISFVDLPSTKIKGLEAVLHSFLAALKTIVIHPDVAHFHNIGPGLFIPLVKMAGIPVVLTYHSPNYEHKKWGLFARLLLRLGESVALKFADRVIFVNKFQMEKYPTAIQEKSKYIPNGIIPMKISNRKDYLEQIGVEPNKYVLSVGRITQEKGFHTLIKAFKMRDMSGYKLVIAGGVEFEHNYMAQLNKLSENAAVVFTGFVQGEALAQLYSNAALYVLASEHEGFPLVLLEAMASKRNVLVSDIPATHLVKLKEEDYFPVGEEKILSQKIAEKLEKVENREYDLTGYNWDSIAEQTAAVLKRAAKVEDGIEI